MAEVSACPFCHEPFEGPESRCPDCGVDLEIRSRPVSLATAADPDDDLDVAPEDATLPWTYMGRGRGLLLGIASVGLVLFFMPWVHESAPEIRSLSGQALASRLNWMWAPFVAWFVMVPLVVTRRSIRRMRGARLAVAFLAAMALATVALRVAFVPASSALRPVRFEWGYGLWATGVLAVAALAAATRFGGARPTAAPPPLA